MLNDADLLDNAVPSGSQAILQPGCRMMNNRSVEHGVISTFRYKLYLRQDLSHGGSYVVLSKPSHRGGRRVSGRHGFILSLISTSLCVMSRFIVMHVIPLSSLQPITA